MQAVPFSGNGKKSDVQLVVEVLGSALQFHQRGERAQERVELALITVDDQGRSANGRSTVIDLNLPPGELERVRMTGVRWLSKLELAPGRYQIRIAARAVSTGVSGLVTNMVDVARFDRQKLSLSGVSMTSLPSVLMPTRGKAWLESSLGMPPTAARTFVAGDQITAAVEVHAPEKKGVEAVVIAELSGPGSTSVRIPSGDTNAAEGDTRAVSFKVDTSKLQKGAFVLQIVATVPGTAERVERRVTFQIM
jgi:hypothetical protein